MLKDNMEFAVPVCVCFAILCVVFMVLRLVGLGSFADVSE